MSRVDEKSMKARRGTDGDKVDNVKVVVEQVTSGGPGHCHSLNHTFQSEIQYRRPIGPHAVTSVTAAPVTLECRM